MRQFFKFITIHGPINITFPIQLFACLVEIFRELVQRLKTVANQKRQVGDFSYNESTNQSTKNRCDSFLFLATTVELGTQYMKPHWALPMLHSTPLSQFDVLLRQRGMRFVFVFFCCFTHEKDLLKTLLTDRPFREDVMEN